MIFAPETPDHLDTAPLDDEDLERLVLSRSPRFQALLDESRKSIAAGKGLSRNQFWKTVAERHRKRAKRS